MKISDIFEDINRRDFMKGLAASAAIGSTASAKERGEPVEIMPEAEVREILLKTLEVYNKMSFGDLEKYYIEYKPSMPIPKVYLFKDIPHEWAKEQFSFIKPADDLSFFHYNRNIIGLAEGWDRYTVFHELVHYIQVKYQNQPPSILNDDNVEMTARMVQLKAKKLQL